MNLLCSLYPVYSTLTAKAKDDFHVPLHSRFFNEHFEIMLCCGRKVAG